MTAAAVNSGGAQTPEQRLVELGLTLPTPAPPAGAYVSTARSDRYVYVSGQLPTVSGELPATGKVGADLDAERAKELARTAALNAIAALGAELGDLSRVRRIVKVLGFVASDPGFAGQSQVVNGASELLRDVFGAAGAHARSAIGVAALPLDAPVEVELIAEVE